MSATNCFCPNEVRNLFQNQDNFAQLWGKKFQNIDASSSDQIIENHHVFSGQAAIFRAVLSGLATHITQI